MSQIDQTVIGICGVCGGEVVLPKVWYSVTKPVPKCVKCNRVAKQKGSVIEMEPKTKAF